MGERLEVRFEDVTEEFEYFAIKRGEMAEELGERLDVFNAVLTEMVRRHDRVGVARILNRRL
jgi:hypothetical protein